MDSQHLKKKKLPDSPGIYLFKKGREVLYIGKATSLRDRVRSYFSSDLIKTRGPRIVDMVTMSTDVEYRETDSVLEALVLESNMIKKYQPKANVKEKDDKSYNYIVITKEDFPVVKTERGRAIEFEGKKYKYVFGPYPHGGQLREALKIVRKIFPFREGKQLSTLYREIGLEPDTSDTKAKKEYQRNINHLRLFFSGKKKELLKSLEKEMKRLAKAEEFEKADKVKRQIFALEHIRDVSLLKEDQREDGVRIEAYDVAHMQGENTVGVMTVVVDGLAKKSDYKKFIIRKAKRGDDVGALREVLERRLKHSEWPLPEVMVIDGGVGQRNMALKVLREYKVSIPVVNVVKDERHKPQKFIGDEKIVGEYKKDFLLANSEAHRFAISFYRAKHRKMLLE